PKLGTYFTEQAYAEHDEGIAAQRQAQNFVNSCLGNETLIVQPEQALKINKIIDAIYRSSETDQSIKLNEL
ncbi:gfo/Idh/MocA family oxidoreductase, partial [Staphylococcus aureus]|nr:gfo/Idh/MocA family oxidoreductase [Staphylococcus aureus]